MTRLLGWAAGLGWRWCGCWAWAREEKERAEPGERGERARERFGPRSEKERERTGLLGFGLARREKGYLGWISFSYFSDFPFSFLFQT